MCANFSCGRVHCLEPAPHTSTEACPSAVSNERVYETTELLCYNVTDLRLLQNTTSEYIPLADREIGLTTGSRSSLCCPFRVASSLDAPPAINPAKLMLTGLYTGEVDARTLVHS